MRKRTSEQQAYQAYGGEETQTRSQTACGRAPEQGGTGDAGDGHALDALPDRSDTPDTPDEALVERLKEGDRAAFDLLYDRYYKRIYYFLDRRLGNRADTEEVVQEVFINVFSSIDGYRGDAAFGAWIFGLTRRTLASRFKRKRHPTVPLSDEETDSLAPAPELPGGPSIEPSPLESYEYRERVARMLHALDHQLNDEQRRLFEMHHIEAMPISQIATVLSKSQDAVKSNLYRARKLLLAR